MTTTYETSTYHHWHCKFVWIPVRWGVLNITLCDQVCQWLATGWCFSPGTPVSSISKTDCHDITEILLEVGLNTITQTLLIFKVLLRWYHTLQGDNSLKSVERFDHMMFVCRFQASRWSKPQREKLLFGWWIYSSESVCWNLLKFDIYYSGYIQTHCQKKIRKLNEQIKFYLKCMVPP